MKKFCMCLLTVLFACNAYATTDIAADATTGDCDESTLGTYSGSADLEIKWEPNTIPIHWYNQGVLMDVQDAADTCDYNGILTLPSVQPERTGYEFAGWTVKYVIPAEYTQLEYIEGGSELDAFIDLGFPPTPTMQTLLTASVSSNSHQQVIFGASDDAWFVIGKPYAIATQPMYVIIVNGKRTSDNDPMTEIDITISANTKYQYKINYPTVGTIGVNDTTQTAYTNLTTVSSHNLYLFTYNPDRITNIPERMKFYSLTLWDHGDKIHDYIPVKRNSDNVVGIYDTVTQTFLTSYASALVAGPAVQ